MLPVEANRESERRYKTAKVMSASAPDLIVILFEQFLELIPDIVANIHKKSAATVEPDAERAQAIVDELINSLDFNVELSKDLGAIYIYVRDRIMDANIRFDADIWVHIGEIMRPLYEGFKEAAKSLAAPAAGVSINRGPAIIAGMTYGGSVLNEVVVNTRSGIRV